MQAIEAKNRLEKRHHVYMKQLCLMTRCLATWYRREKNQPTNFSNSWRAVLRMWVIGSVVSVKRMD